MNAIKAFLCTISVSKFQFFNGAQWRQIYTGFRWYNLTRAQVKVYAKKWVSAGRMRFCKRMLDQKFPAEELEEWLNMRLNRYLFISAIEARRAGAPKEQVCEYISAFGYVKNSFPAYIQMVREQENKQ